MFNEEFRKLRKAKKMTQPEIAEALSVSQPTITSWENGTRKPDIEMLSTIADFFGVTTDELLGRQIPEDDANRIWEFREAMRNDERRTLMDFATNGKMSAIRQINAINDAMRATNPDFYDGDDPA